MRNIWTVAKRDFKSYFSSPVGYIVVFLFLFMTGFMFSESLKGYARMITSSQHPGRLPSLTEGLLRPNFGNMNVILLFVVPFITMRLFAEEKKQHTIELLLTSPASLMEIVFGKFFSSLLLIGVMLGFTLIYPITLLSIGNAELGPIFSSYLGTLLLASCYISLGVFFSATTDNQIVAAALGFFSILFFWLVSWGAESAGPVWGEVLQYLSLINHFNNFGQGVIATTDVVYYLSFTGFGLFLTHRTLDSYRWR